MTAISLPFRIDGYGRVATTNSDLKVWADRVRAVVTTFVGERVMRPAWGTEVPADLFAAIEDAPSLVYNDIHTAFQDYLPSLTLIDVVLVDEDEGNGTLELEILYQVPSITSDTQTTSLTLQAE